MHAPSGEGGVTHMGQCPGIKVLLQEGGRPRSGGNPSSSRNLRLVRRRGVRR